MEYFCGLGSRFYHLSASVLRFSAAYIFDSYVERIMSV